MKQRITPRTLLSRFLVALLLAGSAYVFWLQIGDVPLRNIYSLITDMGPSIALILLPFGVVMFFDVLGWRHCITDERVLPLRRLFAIRLSTDAVMNTLPAGVAVAEPLRSVMLRDVLGLRMTDAVGATILAKINLAIAQFLFILTGVGLVLLHARQHEGSAMLLDAAGGWTSVLPVSVLALGLLALPYSGPRLSQLLRLLASIPLRPLRRGLARIDDAVRSIDSYVGTFAREHRSRFVTSLLLFTWSWLFMAAETWLILQLLGADISMTQAIVFEGVASIVRLMFFFLPAGIGAQDVSFVAMLQASGIPEAAVIAVAFVLLRRGKELLWNGGGLLLLAWLRVGRLRRREDGLALSPEAAT